MKTVEEQIKGINAKLQQLVKKHTALQKEHLRLSEELNEIKTKEKAGMEKISLLEMETFILKASAGKMDEKERTVFEKQINHYIKDLEKCMTMLNK